MLLTRETRDLRPRIIQTTAAHANHSYLIWGVDGILAVDEALSLQAATKLWAGQLAVPQEMAMQELTEMTRDAIRSMGSGNRVANAASSETRRSPTTIVMKPSSGDYGELLIERFEHRAGFELRIMEYVDGQRDVKKGPWRYTYEPLAAGISKTAYPTIQ